MRVVDLAPQLRPAHSPRTALYTAPHHRASTLTPSILLLNNPFYSPGQPARSKLAWLRRLEQCATLSPRTRRLDGAQRPLFAETSMRMEG